MRLGVLISALLFVTLGTTACAPAQKVMVYHPANAEAAVQPAWPSPESLPRLEYAGELIGERNFVAVDGSEGRGRQFLRWLTGIGRSRGDELRLVRPQSGLANETGQILVTDAGRSSIFVFDTVNGSLDVWTQAERLTDFMAPVDIAQDGRGGYLVSDSELGAVFRLAADGAPLGRLGEGSLIRPTGMAVDPATGNIYVADTGAHNVKVFASTGELVRVVGVPGDNGNIPGELNAPLHIDVSGGKAYVTDALNASIQVFSAEDGAPLPPIGRRGLFIGNLVRPKGVTTDTSGNIYVVESYYDHLLVFDADGQFLLPLGGTGSRPGQFFLPAGAWSDSHDRIFVADMFNGRVVIFRYRGSEG